MSDQTKAALEDAIRAHIADTTPNRTVVAWSLVTACIEQETYGDGSAFYGRFHPNGQPIHVCEGLLRLGLRLIGDTWDECGNE